jgi:RNase H-like domain found in reverse transcriptase
MCIGVSSRISRPFRRRFRAPFKRYNSHSGAPVSSDHRGFQLLARTFALPPSSPCTVPWKRAVWKRMHLMVSSAALCPKTTLWKVPSPRVWSRTLNNAEQNYSTTTEKECFAIVWAINNLRPYLEGVEFTVRTDHQALRWVMNISDAQGRLERWRLRLAEFTFTV